MTVETQARLRFLDEYRRVRYAEGRGSDDSGYYRELPYNDITGQNSAMWEMRARTYRYFENYILPSYEHRCRRPLDILDLGAGNGWMSYRLSLRGHNVCALDIFRDARDGLGAAHHYGIEFPLVEAEFDSLPFAKGAFDLAIYNCSFHYSTDYFRTLKQVRGCLRNSGAVVILDSPIYKKREHGEQMVAERHAEFLRRYGFASDAIPSIGFLDQSMLDILSAALEMRWTIYRPWYGWQWHIRPFKARLQGRRPPSRFWIFVGVFEHR